MGVRPSAQVGLATGDQKFTEQNPELYYWFVALSEIIIQDTAALDAVVGLPDLLSMGVAGPDVIVTKLRKTMPRGTLPADFAVPGNPKLVDMEKVATEFVRRGGSYHYLNVIGVSKLALHDRIQNPAAVPLTPMLPRGDGSPVSPGPALQQYSLPKIELSPNDYVLPVCNEGKNRSQIVYAIMHLNNIPVCDPHGATGGFDPWPIDLARPPRGSPEMDDLINNLTGSLPDLGVTNIWTVEPSDGDTRGVSAMIGLYRQPKVGFREVAMGLETHEPFFTRGITVLGGDVPMGDPDALTAILDPLNALDALRYLNVYGYIEDTDLDTAVIGRKWAAARNWFLRKYYRPSVLRAKAPHGRVVFMCMTRDAATVVMLRLVEASLAFGESLENIFVMEADAADDTDKLVPRDVAVAKLLSMFRFVKPKPVRERNPRVLTEYPGMAYGGGQGRKSRKSGPSSKPKKK